jgi:UDP-N-acetylmuramyl pentapeptide phosphotransferase/UDP-N-acetylglucosamine-1-phosphate transferase
VSLLQGFEPVGAAPATLGTLAVSASVCAAVLFGLLRSPLARRVVDRPNARSMHVAPTPRIGGLAVLAGIAAPLVVLRPDLPAGLWMALALLVAVSLADDLGGIPIALRLPLHVAAAALACAALAPGLSAPWLALAAIAGGWAINLYNFMDGLDGLAGGQAAIGFGAYALAAVQAGDASMALASSAIAGAALGFLLFNFPPARVFMGDAGSTALGLLAAGLGLAGAIRGDWPVWFPVVAFMPFVLDATLTLALRIVAGQRFWEAHREHAYQRLSLMGFGHRRTTLVYYALMASSAAVALWGRASPGMALHAGGLALLMITLYAGVRVGSATRIAAERRS